MKLNNQVKQQSQKSIYDEVSTIIIEQAGRRTDGSMSGKERNVKVSLLKQMDTSFRTKIAAVMEEATYFCTHLSSTSTFLGCLDLVA